MTPEQQRIERDKELAAAEQQLSIALGIDHEELLQKAALYQMLDAMFDRKASRRVQQNAWLQRLDLILPELASRVDSLYPCSSTQFQGDFWPCSLNVGTDHDWDSDKEFHQAETDCQAIGKKLAELLAAVPGPIETVDVIPVSYDSNLAEVAVKRSGEQLEDQADG